ncbi:PPC domain-containing protein [Aeoliella mucimassa]|uniref:Putative subtilase-type serine protease n=1 Tax=Aeoliella mucimassa TaxID=2527972 RepID=A0A518AVS4_9BACT|nr:PPC domain-containing protein [Aeoliella mucimassa]QDU58814.1 putative subtilase-type serine protease precursor [Aeoliella mucimassa]
MKVLGIVIANLLLAMPLYAQKDPHVGYIFPAGGQRGTTVTATVGGQYLQGVDAGYVSGDGIEVRIVKHIKPIPNNVLNMLRQKQRELTKQVREKELTDEQAIEQFIEFAKSKKQPDLTPEKFKELDAAIRDPKRQENAQLEEQVIVEFSIDSGASLEPRELRLRTPKGLTNPVVFQVSQYPEYVESKEDDALEQVLLKAKLPLVINGQILPGDVDSYRFRLRKRTQLVAKVEARSLIPYLADAVPGWFQATLSLQDINGAEGAYSDDDAFDPDPLIQLNIPQTAEYVLEIHDAIYRGREDFVYRITVGEVPRVQSIFPLGCHAGESITLHLTGWNLEQGEVPFDAGQLSAGELPFTSTQNARQTNPRPLVVGELPEALEVEPNNTSEEANLLTLPVVVNGQITAPADLDCFAFQGTKGDQLVAEVTARRIGSPLDSILKLQAPDGTMVAANDDFEDRGAGLTTHQADSLISFTLLQDGEHTLSLGDAQGRGGVNFGYRLRVSHPQPDFALRVVPSSLSAVVGTKVPITVYALRKDGFDGAIKLALHDLPEGFQLSSEEIPADVDKVELTLRVPKQPTKDPRKLLLEGTAELEGQPITHQAIPADDQMQAFLYRHLTPAKECLIMVRDRAGKK